MNMPTLMAAASGPATRSTLVTMAAAMILFSGAANAGDNSLALPMGSPTQSSDAVEYWRADTTTTASTGTGVADGGSKPLWQRRTDNAYLSVYTYYCAPNFDRRVPVAEQAGGREVAIYTSRFRIEYAGDCRAFYLGEIAKRQDSPADTQHQAGRQ